MSVRQTGQFQALGSDGQQYTVIVYTKFETARPFGGRVTEVAKGHFLRTSAGKEVRSVSKGHYNIATTGVTLTSDDPNAP